MSIASAETNAVRDLQQFVNDICTSNGGTVSYSDTDFIARIPASIVSRTDVHNTFLQLHPEHKAFRKRLSSVGMSNPHLCDELWQAAQPKRTKSHPALDPSVNLCN